MDRFYLDNAARYQRLVDAFRPASTGMSGLARVTEKLDSETISSDMVVSARIRPLLDDEIVAGFPCALLPRAAQAGVVDVHDLYNHPKGLPILKV